MNKIFDVQKSITLINEEMDLENYLECAIYLIQAKTKVIIVGKENFYKVTDILDDINNIRSGFDSLYICDTDCYIHKSMLKNKNVYLSVKDFLNDFPEIRELYLDSISYEIEIE